MNDIHKTILGLQHIGIPTMDVQKTVDFYALFGFEVIWQRLEPAEDRVAFLKNGNCVLETYFAARPAMQNGAVDHVALDVADIEAVYAYVHELGFEVLEGKITTLPFFENGVRYFTILGPNHEKVEFNQKL